MKSVGIALLLTGIVIGSVGYQYWQPTQARAEGPMTTAPSEASVAGVATLSGVAPTIQIAGQMTLGKIVSVDGNTLVLEAPDGTQTTVQIADDAIITRLPEGDGVTFSVAGVPAEPGEPGIPEMGTTIVIESPTDAAAPILTPADVDVTTIHAMTGTVTVIGGEVIAGDGTTVALPAGEPAMGFAISTFAPAGETLALTDLQPGMTVSVLGEADDAGVIQAKGVTVLPEAVSLAVPTE